MCILRLLSSTLCLRSGFLITALCDKVFCLIQIYFNADETAKSSSTTSLAADSTVHQNVLSALNKHSTNTRPFNPWIPGMVVGIQKHVGDAIGKLKKDSSFRYENEKAESSELLQHLFKVLVEPIKIQLEAVYKPGDTLVFVPHENGLSSRSRHQYVTLEIIQSLFHLRSVVFYKASGPGIVVAKQVASS